MTTFGSGSALIVVDFQNDFADPNGSLAVAGGANLVGAINAATIRALSAGGIVVYTQDWHPPSTPHFAKDGGIWPDHCVMASWGADFHPRLLVAGPVVRKGTNGEDGYSGFTMRDPTTGETTPTQLAGILEAAAIEEVVVAGLALDYCVQATALDAAGYGWVTRVRADLTAPVNLQPDDGQKAVAALLAAGVHVDGHGARRTS